MRLSYVVATSFLCAAAAWSQSPPAPPAPPRAPRTPRTVVVQHRQSSYLGVGVAEIDSERAKALKLPEERGVEVKSVAEDSPAAKAGIKENDVVLDYNGQPVQGAEQFQRLVRETPVGRNVKIAISRGGSQQTVTATIAERKLLTSARDGSFTFNLPIPVIPDIPHVEMSWRNSVLGIEAQSLNPQLADYFGVKEGVLVSSVIKNSAAEKAGIKAGDVILKVDDSKVTSPREISSILRSTRTKSTFSVVLMRNRKEMTVTVTYPERQKGSRADAVAVLC